MFTSEHGPSKKDNLLFEHAYTCLPPFPRMFGSLAHCPVRSVLVRVVYALVVFDLYHHRGV